MYTVSDFYKNIFQTKVYKISLNTNCTCPNRDGKVGFGGCIFCNQNGSGDFTEFVTEINIEQKIEKAKQLVLNKMPKSVEKQNQKFIVYFQSFTNTYGNINELKKIWFKAISLPQIVGIALGTRPDCITKEVLQVLSKISEKCFVQIELGFQTSNEKTAKFINRCYKNKVYKNAIKKIHKTNKNIHIITHIILGLPTINKNKIKIENEKQMLKTVKYCIKSKTNGIKITNLYVLKNTKLENLFNQQKILTLSLEQYIGLLKKIIKIIPQSIVIHRLTGDPPKNQIISPLWCTNKKMVMNKIKNELDE